MAGTFGGIEFGQQTFGGTSTSTSTGTVTFSCSEGGIVDTVQTMLNESGPGIFWPVQDVFDAINDAQMEKESIAYYPIVTASITFTQGADLVPLLTNTMMWPHYLEFNGRQYWIIKQADLERYDRNWRSATQDQPRFFVLWDESHLRPYPLADQTYVFNIWGPGWGTEITSATTDFTATNALLKLSIAMKAASRLFQYTRPDLAEAFMKESEEYEQKFRIQWRRQQGDNIKRLRPGTAYTAAQGGSIRIGKRIDGNPSNPYR